MDLRDSMKEKVKIHSTAFVSEEAQIGEGTSIWQNCNVLKGAVIGTNCNLGANVYIETGVILGNNVKVKNNIALYDGVECEDDVFLGPNCVFTNVINPRSFIERKHEFKKTLVKKGATIGANATVLCGHSIGRYAMIGAGAVVTKDVPDYALLVGNPARRIGSVCKCGCTVQYIDELLTCEECGNKYKEIDGVVQVVEEKN